MPERHEAHRQAQVHRADERLDRSCELRAATPDRGRQAKRPDRELRVPVAVGRPQHRLRQEVGDEDPRERVRRSSTSTTCRPSRRGRSTANTQRMFTARSRTSATTIQTQHEPSRGREDQLPDHRDGDHVHIAGEVHVGHAQRHQAMRGVPRSDADRPSARCGAGGRMRIATNTERPGDGDGDEHDRARESDAGSRRGSPPGAGAGAARGTRRPRRAVTSWCVAGGVHRGRRRGQHGVSDRGGVVHELSMRPTPHAAQGRVVDDSAMGGAVRLRDCTR